MLEEIRPYTKSPFPRMEAMVEAVERIDRTGIAGDVVECGVWMGGNIILARKLSPQRVCWLYDTFAGMTLPTVLDVNRRGGTAVYFRAKHKAERGNWMAVSADDVKENLKKFDVFDEEKTKFVVGDVVDTLRVSTNLPERIALLRLDTDFHASTKAELKVLYPLLAPGGILVVDDFGHWLGARKAVNDYFGEAMPEYTMADYSCLVMVKP